MTSQQEFANKFEDYPLEHLTHMGMTRTRNPVLKDGNTPDVLVEHDGRTFYVEVSHIQGSDDLETDTIPSYP